MIPVISFISSRSGMGKTTYLEKLIREMRSRGHRIGVIKHDSHGFEMDVPGKDTWRHSQAGAAVVCISSPEKFALIRKTQQDTPLEEIIPLISDVDYIFVEGFKKHGILRAEIFRSSAGFVPLNSPKDLFAVITDADIYPDLPHFPLDLPEKFADYIEQRFGGSRC